MKEQKNKISDWRKDVIKHMPKGGIVAELGVFEGFFSQMILTINKPEKLHLIDCWETQEDFDDLEKNINANNEKQEQRYDKVVNKFKKEIENNTVEIHRKYTNDAVNDFPDNYFDWIYIDADHRYNGVLSDLTLYLPKLKKDGMYAGDDYADISYLGVIPAVKHFCKDFNFDIYKNFKCPTSQNYNFILKRK